MLASATPSIRSSPSTSPSPSRAKTLLLGAAAALAVAAALAALTASPADAAPRPRPGAAAPAAAGALGPLGPLTALAVRRLRLGDRVAAAKRGTGAPVDDPERERQELAKVRRQAAGLGLDPASTARFFEDQIAASKVVQRGLLARWEADPATAPSERPSLDAIRAELDAVTRDILRELVATERVRRPSAGCAADLAEADVSGSVVHGLDALHREALRTALRSVCR